MAHSMLTSLPPELLHNILSGLDTASLSSARLTCRLFSILGLDHFGDEIPLVFHRDKFRALAEIAAHPVLSKRMRSLYYAGDHLNRQGWYEWLTRRSPEMHYRNAVMEFPTEIELKSRVSRLGPQDTLGVVDVMDLPGTRMVAEAAAFGHFNELCDDQEKMVEERLDLKCLRAMFKGCPKLREVTVAFQSDDRGPQRRLKASRTAFAEAKTVAHGDTHTSAGMRHLMALTRALQYSGRSLESLTVVGANYRALYTGAMIEGINHDFPAGLPGTNYFYLGVLVRPLRRLRVFIHTASGSRYYADEPTLSVFTEAPELRVSRIRLPDRLPDRDLDRVLEPSEKTDDARVREAIYRGINLNYVFRRMTYPHLYELSLANCSVCGPTFIDFILRHKKTLRRLSLQNLMLGAFRHSHNKSWPTLLTYLAGRFPNLHKVTIRGFFFERKYLMMNWSMPQTAGVTETEMCCPARDAVENFILMGSTPPWLHPLSETRDLQKPRWEPKGEGYVAPGIPDNDRPLDDPAREYKEDEFDV